MKTTFCVRRSAALPFALLLTLALALCSAMGGIALSYTAYAETTPSAAAIELIDDGTTIKDKTPAQGKYAFEKGSNKDADAFCYPFHNTRLDNDRYYKADATQINDFYPSKVLNAQIKFKWDIGAIEPQTGYSEFGGIIGAFGDKYLTVSLYGYAYGSDSFSQVVPVFGTASKGDASVVTKIDDSINWTSPGENALLFAVGNTIEFIIDKSPTAVTATMQITDEAVMLTRTITLDATKISGLNEVSELSLAFGPSRRATGGKFYDYSCKIWHETETLAGECTEHRASTDFMHSDATHWNVCTVCGETIGKETHTLTENVTQEATRETEGKKTVSCEECSYSQENVTIPKVRDEFTAGNTTYGGAIKQQDGSFVFEKQGGVHSYPFANVSLTDDFYIKEDKSSTVSSKALATDISFKWEIGDLTDDGGDRLGAVIGAYDGKDLFVYCWGGSNNRISLTYQYGTQILNFWGANWDLSNGAGYFVKGNILEFTVNKSSSDIKACLTVKNSSGEALSKMFVVQLSESFTDSGVTAFFADQVTLAFGPFTQGVGGKFYDYSVKFQEDIRANYVYIDGNKIQAPDVRAGETVTIDFANAVLQGPLAETPIGYKVETKIGDGEWVTVAENTEKASVKISVDERVAADSDLSVCVTPIADGMTVLGGEKTVQVAAVLPRLATPANVRIDGDVLRYGRAPTVRWDAVENANCYTLEYKRGDGAWETLYEGNRTYFAAVETIDSFVSVTYRVTASQTDVNRTYRPSLAGVTEELTVAKGVYAFAPILTAVAELTKITVDAVDGCEYRLNDGEWQDSNVFEGLAANTEYTVSIRFKGTDTIETGEIVSEKFTTQSIVEPEVKDNGKGCGSTVVGSGIVFAALALTAALSLTVARCKKKE